MYSLSKPILKRRHSLRILKRKRVVMKKKSKNFGRSTPTPISGSRVQNSKTTSDLLLSTSMCRVTKKGLRTSKLLSEKVKSSPKHSLKRQRAAGCTSSTVRIRNSSKARTYLRKVSTFVQKAATSSVQALVLMTGVIRLHMKPLFAERQSGSSLCVRPTQSTTHQKTN